MSEKETHHRLPETFEPTSPEQQLEILLDTLEALSVAEGAEAEDEKTRGARAATEERIAELKQQHPELNN